MVLLLRCAMTLRPRGCIAGGVSGIHPDSSRNVLIEDCFVDVGDDGIVVASYRDFYGIPKPAANITVRRCTVLSRNIAIGAGTAGGIQGKFYSMLQVRF